MVCPRDSLPKSWLLLCRSLKILQVLLDQLCICLLQLAAGHFFAISIPAALPALRSGVSPFARRLALVTSWMASAVICDFSSVVRVEAGSAFAMSACSLLAAATIGVLCAIAMPQQVARVNARR